MIDELLSLRVVVVARSADDQDLFRQAFAAAPVPVDLAVARGPADVGPCLSGGADLVYVDGALAPAEIGQTIAAARAAPNSPFVVLLSDQGGGGADSAADAIAEKPRGPDEVKRLTDRSIRLRLPSRVLVVDDSSTMRSIVCKMLEATRFPFEITEADEGFAALKLTRASDFDIAFLDYNMPGFSGLETLAEFRREKRRMQVVIMTSLTDETLAERARDQGAAFLKKPFFPADIEALLCRYYGLRALVPKRA